MRHDNEKIYLELKSDRNCSAKKIQINIRIVRIELVVDIFGNERYNCPINPSTYDDLEVFFTKIVNHCI